MGLVSWREMADYKSLCTLNIAFKESSSKYNHIPFPALGNKYSQSIMECMRLKVFNLEKINTLERHRAQMETWINCIMNNIFTVSSNVRHICRCLFFSSEQNCARFDSWMRSNGIHEANLDIIEEGEDESRQTTTQLLFSITGSNNPIPDNSAVLSRQNLNKALKKKDYLLKNVAGSETNNSDNGSESRSILSSFFKHKTNKSVMSEDTVREISGTSSIEDVIQALSAQNKTSILMTTAVQRGQEAESGVQLYNVYLRIQGKTSTPIIHRVFQRYNGFKKLCSKLIEIDEEVTSRQNNSNTTDGNPSGRNNSTGMQMQSTKPAYAHFMKLVTSPFPTSPIKSYLGLSLNDAELTERCTFC